MPGLVAVSVCSVLGACLWNKVAPFAPHMQIVGGRVKRSDRETILGIDLDDIFVILNSLEVVQMTIEWIEIGYVESFESFEIHWSGDVTKAGLGLLGIKLTFFCRCLLFTTQPSLFVFQPHNQSFFIKSVMILTGLIRIERVIPGEPEPEDILGSSLTTLFTDDILLQHGDSTSHVVYMSRFGDLKFECADVNGEEERRKFAHYLWNAGILMGDLVGGKPEIVIPGATPTRQANITLDFWKRREFSNGRSWWLDSAEESSWNVKGQSVLELGAGWDIHVL